MARIKIILIALILFGFSAKAQHKDSIKHIKINPAWVSPKVVFNDTPLTKSEQNSVENDEKILNDIPKKYDTMTVEALKKLSYELGIKINNLILEKDTLIRNHANSRVIESREQTLSLLIKDKQIMDLTMVKTKLRSEEDILKAEKRKLRRYLITSSVGLLMLVLVILIMFQRGRIKSKNNEILKQLQVVNKKNTYLEYAAKIIRHDMHSGINTYIPRGVSSLERRLTPGVISDLKLETPLKILKEGLAHSQKVYKGVYEFTNLVKKDAVLNKETCDLKKILVDYLSNTSYISQVSIEELSVAEVNQSLFCTAIDNLIRNGLKYNDNDIKKVNIYRENNNLVIQDNGRGMTQEEFEQYSKPYTRKEGQKESGTGLGLNICIAILQEHKFDVFCEKNKIGTKIKIKVK